MKQGFWDSTKVMRNLAAGPWRDGATSELRYVWIGIACGKAISVLAG